MLLVCPCTLVWNGIELCWIGIPNGRVMFCTIAMPSVCMTLRATAFSTSMSAGLRMSWSASTIRMSGFILACEKCRSAAAKPMLTGASAGR